VAAPTLLVAVPQGAPARCSDERRPRLWPRTPLSRQISSGGAPPNRRLELAGLSGRRSIDRLMTREAEVERMIVSARVMRPQLKRER
jgi:hypothetical protein